MGEADTAEVAGGAASVLADAPPRGAVPVPTPAKPARVVGVFPSGHAEVVPDVTVVFSHPVVPLGAVGEASSVPFRWEPEVAGSWSWLDATTARFNPQNGRLPGGQAYRLLVDPRYGGATGEGLSVPLSHEEHLRVRGPLALAGSGIDRIHPQLPLLVLGFDQAVDSAVVASHGSFRVLGRSPGAEPTGSGATRVVPAVARSLSEAEEGYRDAVRSGRYPGAVALSPAEPLPPGVWVRLELSPDLVSSEGPEPTGRRQDLVFRTADVFRLVGSRCPAGRPPCTMTGSHRIDFSNPVDPEQPLEERIRLTPEVPGLVIRAARGGALDLYGPFRPWTTYRVEVDAELVDVFGSPLGAAAETALNLGRASARLSIRGAPFATLDPSGSRDIELSMRSLDRVEVRILAADPARWREWVQAGPDFRHDADARLAGLSELERMELVPEDDGDGFSFVHLPLARALDAAGGQVVVVLSGFQDRPRESIGTRPPPDAVAHAWVQSPSVRLQLVADGERMVVLTRGLDGNPAAGVRLSLPEAGVQAVSDAEGFASLPLHPRVEEAAHFLVAEQGGRTTLVPSAPFGRTFPRWLGQEGAPGPVWAATLDRPLYRPGEPLAFQGWVQETVPGEARDLRAPELIRAVRHEVLVPTGGGRATRTLESGQLELSPSGGFHARVDLPADLAPGSARVRLTALTLDAEGELRPEPGWTRDLHFPIADFRRPDYAVTVSRPPRLLLPDEPFQVTAEARYFDGPGLPGSELRWTVSARAGSYSPPAWMGPVPTRTGEARTLSGRLQQWRFGNAPNSPSAWARGRPSFEPVVLDSRTDAEGRHHLQVTPTTPRDPFPLTLFTSVTVQDLNRQAGSASATSILLPGEALPGLRLIPLVSNPSGRMLAGDSIDVEVVVLDANGDVVPQHGHGPPHLRVQRLVRDPASEGSPPHWRVDGSTPARCLPAPVPTPLGSPHDTEVDGYRCRAVLAEAGEWLASVEVSDARGRVSRAEVNVPVLGSDRRVSGWALQFPAAAGLGVPALVGEPLDLELEGHAAPWNDLLPGDTVTLRIEAPFPGGQGMAALDHGGIRSLLPVTMDAGQTEQRIRVPLLGAPGSRSLEVVLESPEGDRGAMGTVRFEVAPDARRLALTVDAPEARVEPGATVPVSVTVTDGEGAPVADAEVTIWLVDEAALFAGGFSAQADMARQHDPWASLYRIGSGVQARAGLWMHRLRERRPPGEGELQLRLLDAGTGGVPPGRLEVTASDGSTRSARLDPNGEVLFVDLPPGDLRIQYFLTGDEPVLERLAVRKGDEGVELGTLLVPIRVPPQAGREALSGPQLRAASPQDLPPPNLGLDEVVVAGGELAEREDVQIAVAAFTIAVPAPPEPGGEGEAGLLREDFTPLAGMEPRVLTGTDGVARATFRLPDTLTRYRILAVARSGEIEGPSVGVGEGLVVAGQELVVRATPPRFLRAGDLGEISLLVENGGDADHEVEVAVRAEGLVLEGTGGVRLQVPAGGRREVTLPARATAPGVAAVQARAVSAAAADAVAVRVPVEIPAAPEHMAFRALLETGEGRTVLLEPWTAVHPGWGGLQVIVSPSPTGGLGAELLALAETPLPWAGLRIARVRGAAALARAMERDPALGAALDSTALAALHRAVAEDIDALGGALRQVWTNSVPPIGFAGAARAMGGWSAYTVLEASEALEEARRAGLLSTEVSGPGTPTPLEGGLLQHLLLRRLLGPEPSRGPPTAPSLGAFDLAMLWTIHRSERGLPTLPSFILHGVANLDAEAMRPLWLARVAAMLVQAQTEEPGRSALPPGAHRPFLQALENRARITPGGVTFRRGAPLPGALIDGAPADLSFSASSPAEDAEILLALVEAAPSHPLLSGLVASVAAPDGVDDSGDAEGNATRVRWGPEVVGHALPALEAWAQLHIPGPVDAEVFVGLPGGSPNDPAGAALRVRSGEPSQSHAVSMIRLLDAQGGQGIALAGTPGTRLSLPFSLEARSQAAGGLLSARALLSWTAADPFQPALARGFVVRRSYEGVDDPDDVRRDPDGTWRVRAGARVRVLHELLLPERRVDLRLEDPFPAGFEPIQAMTGDEGAGRAPEDAGAEFLVDGRWGLTGGAEVLLAVPGLRWYRELRFGRDQATAWAPTLGPGSWRGSWVARATLPGEYIVPGARVHEAGRPDVMGRSEAHRVVVEMR